MRRATMMMRVPSLQTEASGGQHQEMREKLREQKELLQTLRAKPWPMRRRLQTLRQSKTYIENIEGHLSTSRGYQEASARYLRKMNRWLTNIRQFLIPWELRIRQIESHFGTVVASYFIFLRWILWVNIAITAITVSFIILPAVLSHGAVGEANKVLTAEEIERSKSLRYVWDFQGSLKASVLFYGYYTNENILLDSYKLPLAYFLASLAVYGYSFVATLRKMAGNAKLSKLSSKDDQFPFSWRLYTGWDFMVGNAETAANKVAALSTILKESIIEVKEQQKQSISVFAIFLRVVAHVVVMILLLSSGYAVYLVVDRSRDYEKKDPDDVTWWQQNEVSMVVSLITLLFPTLFDIVGRMERHHPRTQLRLQLARILALYLLNLYTLVIALLNKVNALVAEIEKIEGNVSREYLPPSVSEASLAMHTLLLANQTDDDDTLATVANGNDSASWASSAPGGNVTYTRTINGRTAVAAAVSVNGSTAMIADDIRDIMPEESDVFLQSISPSIAVGAISDYPSLPNDTLVTSTAAAAAAADVTESTLSLSNITAHAHVDGGVSMFDYVTSTVAENLGWGGTESEFEMRRSGEGEEEEAWNDTEANSLRSIIEKGTFNITLMTGRPWEKIDDWSDGSLAGMAATHAHNVTSLPAVMSTNNVLLSKDLCWETMVGQELVKLTIMDLLLTVASIIVIDFVRGLTVRGVRRIYCWNLETQFPEYGEFKIAENILHLVNNQGMIWLGTFFSPALPSINTLKLLCIMYIRSWAVLTCNIPHERVFRASRSNNFYFALLLTMLFLCVLPVCYAIVWLEPSFSCGPFRNYDRMYHVLTKTMDRKFPSWINSTIAYIASPVIIIPLFLLLSLAIYYLVSIAKSLKEANQDLRKKLHYERTEEKRKVYAMAEAKRVLAKSITADLPNHETSSRAGRRHLEGTDVTISRAKRRVRGSVSLQATATDADYTVANTRPPPAGGNEVFNPPPDRAAPPPHRATQLSASVRRPVARRSYLFREPSSPSSHRVYPSGDAVFTIEAGRVDRRRASPAFVADDAASPRVVGSPARRVVLDSTTTSADVHAPQRALQSSTTVATPGGPDKPRVVVVHKSATDPELRAASTSAATDGARCASAPQRERARASSNRSDRGRAQRASRKSGKTVDKLLVGNPEGAIDQQGIPGLDAQAQNLFLIKNKRFGEPVSQTDGKNEERY